MVMRRKKKRAKHLLVGESIHYRLYYEYKTSEATLVRIREAWEHRKDGCEGPGVCTSTASHASSDIKRGRFYERIRNEYLKITQIRRDNDRGEVILAFEGFGTFTYTADEDWVFKTDQVINANLEGLLQPPARTYGDRLSELFPLMA